MTTHDPVVQQWKEAVIAGDKTQNNPVAAMGRSNNEGARWEPVFHNNEDLNVIKISSNSTSSSAFSEVLVYLGAVKEKKRKHALPRQLMSVQKIKIMAANWQHKKEMQEKQKRQEEWLK